MNALLKYIMHSKKSTDQGESFMKYYQVDPPCSQPAGQELNHWQHFRSTSSYLCDHNLDFHSQVNIILISNTMNYFCPPVNFKSEIMHYVSICLVHVTFYLSRAQLVIQFHFDKHSFGQYECVATYILQKFLVSICMHCWIIQLTNLGREAGNKNSGNNNELQLILAGQC